MRPRLPALRLAPGTVPWHGRRLRGACTAEGPCSRGRRYENRAAQKIRQRRKRSSSGSCQPTNAGRTSSGGASSVHDSRPSRPRGPGVDGEQAAGRDPVRNRVAVRPEPVTVERGPGGSAPRRHSPRGRGRRLSRRTTARPSPEPLPQGRADPVGGHHGVRGHSASVSEKNLRVRVVVLDALDACAELHVSAGRARRSSS